MVAALWAVVLPVAYRLWQKLAFLETRRKSSNIDTLAVARPGAVSIRSVMPPEALPTEAPSMELRVAHPELGLTSEPELSIAPLDAPWSTPPSSSKIAAALAAQSVAPTMLDPRSMAARPARTIGQRY